MSFWTDLGNELSAGVKALGADLTKIATYFKPMIQASAQELGSLALQAVLAEAPKVISGTEKFSAATSSVITTLGAAGKQVAITDAQTAVQAAYNYVSASVNPPTSPH